MKKLFLLSILLTGCSTEVTVADFENAQFLCKPYGGLTSIVKFNNEFFAKCENGKIVERKEFQ
jgi:hypothetical protein